MISRDRVDRSTTRDFTVPKAWNKADGGIPDTGSSALGYYLKFTDFYGNLWSICICHKILLPFSGL